MSDGTQRTLQIRDEEGRLRVRSEGGHPVGDVLDLLNAFNAAYDGLSLFNMVLEGYVNGSVAGNSRISRGRWLRFISRLTDYGLKRELNYGQQLILASVELSSPGFWEFMGTLMPLEVLRRYLDDRHRRRQDRAYREGREDRRLQLENMLLENQVIRGRIAAARQLGMTNGDISQLLERFIVEPFRLIDQVETRGMILPGEAGETEPEQQDDWFGEADETEPRTAG